MAFEHRDECAMHHARQGFVLAVFFTAVLVLLASINVLAPKVFRVTRFVIVMMIYAAYLAYFGLCAWGTVMARKRQMTEIPVVHTYAARLEI